MTIFRDMSLTEASPARERAFGGGGLSRWRERLAKLVQVAPTLQPPDKRFRVLPPSGTGWCIELPAGGTLPDFYTRCDGGTFPEVWGLVEYFPLSQLVMKSRELGEQLQIVLGAEDRVSPFVFGRHVLFGWDTVGDLYLLWDAERDELVGYMPHDDHDWVSHESASPVPMQEYFAELLSSAPNRVGSPLSRWWVGLLADLDGNTVPGT
jgi:hypothetical protein